ncbi:uncharacterized protein LOC105084855 [Camelus dromedarius]|uniref:uncharacterized protein LOC105084855 n=1 Tax=Camelus dromedarius TaxID=9838 RepID=UPI0031194156
MGRNNHRNETKQERMKCVCSQPPASEERESRYRHLVGPRKDKVIRHRGKHSTRPDPNGNPCPVRHLAAWHFCPTLRDNVHKELQHKQRKWREEDRGEKVFPQPLCSTSWRNHKRMKESPSGIT